MTGKAEGTASTSAGCKWLSKSGQGGSGWFVQRFVPKPPKTVRSLRQTVAGEFQQEVGADCNRWSWHSRDYARGSLGR